MNDKPTQELAIDVASLRAEIAGLRREMYALNNTLRGRTILLLGLIDQLVPEGVGTTDDAIESLRHILAHGQVAGNIHGNKSQFAVFDALLETLKEVEGDLFLTRPAQ